MYIESIIYKILYHTNNYQFLERFNEKVSFGRKKTDLMELDKVSKTNYS